MIDLIYQSGSSKFLGSDRAEAGEMLPVIDVQGFVTGQASRKECHERHLLHPVVHLHIIDRYSKIYLQRRSATKDLLPLYWDTAVGGHISYGEYSIEALFREAGEELGLHDFNPIGITSYIFESEHDLEMVLVFAIVGNFNPVPDDDEVCEGKFWELSEIDDAIGKGILTPQFEQEYLKIKDKLIALL